MSEEQKKVPNGEEPSEQETSDSQPEAGKSEESEEQSLNAAYENAQKELLYLRADMENTRKRMAREQEQAIRFSHEKLFRELVNVVDLFDRGLELAPKLKERFKQDTEALNFVTGMELTHRELTQLMTKFGAEFVGKVGERFDPNRHEAISEESASDPSKDGTVARVLQKGVLLHGRLLSPARVVVAKLNE